MADTDLFEGVARLSQYEEHFYVISTTSINMKDLKATIQLKPSNYIVVLNADISYVGWLAKESTVKCWIFYL